MILTKKFRTDDTRNKEDNTPKAADDLSASYNGNIFFGLSGHTF